MDTRVGLLLCFCMAISVQGGRLDRYDLVREILDDVDQLKALGPEDTKPCKDLRENCEGQIAKCNIHKEFYKTYCAKTCKFCSGQSGGIVDKPSKAPAAGCFDVYETCAYEINRQAQSSIPRNVCETDAFFKANCRKSCGGC